MATISRDITLKHRANVGEEVEDVDFQQGDEVTVLQEWSAVYLCKDGDGRVFNIPKDYIEGA